MKNKKIKQVFTIYSPTPYSPEYEDDLNKYLADLQTNLGCKILDIQVSVFNSKDGFPNKTTTIIYEKRV